MLIDELIALPFVVHNNRESDLSVDVTFYNSAQDFLFPQLDTKQTNKSRKCSLKFLTIVFLTQYLKTK